MQLDVISWFLLTLFIGVFADKRLVIQDSLVCLFQNVTPDNAVKEVTLYVNGVENPTHIVTFTFQNGYISMDWNPHMAANYSKIYMDPNRNICIANIDETYERKFKIQSSTILGEVELTILRNLTGEQIGQIRKLLDDHSEQIKGYLGNLTGEQIGQIRKLLDDHSEQIKGYLGNLTEEQIKQIRKLQDLQTYHIDQHLGRSIYGIYLLLIVLIIKDWIIKLYEHVTNWIREKFCSEHTKAVVANEVSKSCRDENYEDMPSAPKINMKAAQKGDKTQTGVDQSGKRNKKDPNSDDPSNIPLMLQEDPLKQGSTFSE